MNEIIENAAGVTPDWLTALFRVRGVLPQGRVERVTAGEPHPAFGSAIWRLTVAYSGRVPPDAPRRLFLKCASPALVPGDFDPEQLAGEIDFYRNVAPLMNGMPFLIPVYAAARDPRSGASHLLMKDISDTHIASQDPAMTGHCESAAAVLAQLHAAWWDHPLLGTRVGSFPTPAEREREIQETNAAVTRFLDETGDQLRAAWCANYERVLTALPGLFRRHASGRNLTLVHGDAHLGNFLFPRPPHTLPTCLLDWQFWHPTISGTDLAFMMAVEWDTDIRRGLEQHLLRQYHQQLTALGVTGYTWENCRDDYRLSLILVSIFIPVWQRVVFGWPVNLDSVEHSMTAFEDWHCRELLAG